jgi:hypothetical protein
MKTIDTKSLLLGAIATCLVFLLSSGKMPEQNDNISFVSSPTGVGIYNKTTRTIYLYKLTFGGLGLVEKPSNIYEVMNEGSSLTKKD